MAGWEQRGAPGAHGGWWPGDRHQAQEHKGVCGALCPLSVRLHECSHLPWVPEEPPAPGDSTGPGFCSAGSPFLGAPPLAWHLAPEHREHLDARSRPGPQLLLASACAAHSNTACLLNQPIYPKGECACTKGYFCWWLLIVQFGHWCLNSFYHPSKTQRMF